MWYKNKQQYLSILAKVCDQIPPLDSKAKREAFYETADLIYSEAILFGIGHWIIYKQDEARGWKSSVEEIIRDNLSYSLAKLKFTGKVPPPIELKLASLFDIKGWEIDEYAEFYQYDPAYALNQSIPPGGFQPHTAEVVEFASDKTARTHLPVGCRHAGTGTAEVISFPDRRRDSPVKAA